MVESTYGDSHPGSGHLNILVEEVRKGIAEEGGFGARYHCTDICDGESQGTDGINYSLASREMIANMIEIHANATPFDAGVYLSSCDKGVPGNLMGLARVNIPSVFVPGGTMNAGPEMLTLEQLGMYSAKFERGEIGEEKLDWAKCNACPKEMFRSVLRARPFDSEEECLDAVLKHKVQKGDAVFIRYEERDAECRKCSILLRQSAATKNLERVLP